MEGFYNFTDVQVANSICFTLFWIGFMTGTVFTGLPYYVIKWFIQKYKVKHIDKEDVLLYYLCIGYELNIR